MMRLCNDLIILLALSASSRKVKSFHHPHPHRRWTTTKIGANGVRTQQVSSAATNNNEDTSTITSTTTTSTSSSTTTTTTTSTTTPQHHKRRKRYAGRYPRNFQDKYKERDGDEETIRKVLAKGMTPAGQHVPIMVKECLYYMGLSDNDNDNQQQQHSSNNNNNDDDDPIMQKQQQQKHPLVVVDCTLGYGGHSSYILNVLKNRNDGSRLIAFDQDSVEIQKTEERLRKALKENKLPSLLKKRPQHQQKQNQNNVDSADDDVEEEASSSSSDILLNNNNNDDDSNDDDDDIIFTAVNQNFQTVESYLSSNSAFNKNETTTQQRKVTNLLADLGLSSMQIDDNDRGFTYKREGPLDMRMNNPSSSDNDNDDNNNNINNQETAYDLLSRIRVGKLKSMLKENSDEEFAVEIAQGLIGNNGAKKKKKIIPKTTIELADRVRDIVRPLLIEKKFENKNLSNKQKTEMKKMVDSTIARVMQAIRIEVNGEFRVLEKLLDDLPHILAPGGKAVFLTFHSGEDRRVKKSFKAGFKGGIYSDWSDKVVRPNKEERRNNPRSSCCKLRWAIRSDVPPPMERSASS